MRLILSFFPFPIDLISIFSRSFILEWRNRFKIMAPSIIPFFFVLLDVLKRELSITKNRLSLKAALFLIVDDLRTLYYASIVAYSFNLCQSQSVPLHWRLHATQIMLIKRSNQVVLIYVLRKWVIQTYVLLQTKVFYYIEKGKRQRQISMNSIEKVFFLLLTAQTKGSKIRYLDNGLSVDVSTKAIIPRSIST